MHFKISIWAVFSAFLLLLASTKVPAQSNNTGIIFRQDNCKRHKHVPVTAANSAIGDIQYIRAKWYLDNEVWYIRGEISYFFNMPDNTSEFILNLANNLNVDSVVYHNKSISFEHLNNKLLFTELKQNNGTDSITVYYQGKPESDGFGSFEQTWHKGIGVLWTLSEPYGAEKWWPAFNSLVDKIDSMDIFIYHPPGTKAVANGLREWEIPVDNSTLETFWKLRSPIATYLVAVAVTNYTEYSEYVDLAGKNLLIQNFVYPEDASSAAQRTPDLHAAIQLFNDLFIPYPFADEKYGHAQFNRGGGMEHQTVSFVGNFDFPLLAHELAHQWFGNYITCGSWQDIWLNEGFAVYLEGITAEHGISVWDWNHWKQSRIQHITSKPGGSVWVDDTTSVSRIFDGRLSYSKAGMLLHMLRHEMGDTAFFGGIKTYLNDNKLANGFARTPQLVHHWETAADTSLSEFFNDWFYGQGFPIYHIYWGQNQQNQLKITIFQESSHPSVHFFEMHVPLSLVSDRDTAYIRLKNTFSGQEFILDHTSKVEQVLLNSKHDIVAQGQVLQPESDENAGFSVVKDANESLILLNTELRHVQQIELFNMTGGLQLRFQINNSDLINVIYTNQVSAGAYLLRIDLPERSQTNKIIVY